MCNTAIGDEFDGFIEEGYTPRKSYTMEFSIQHWRYQKLILFSPIESSNPLSYTACQEFATQFDRVYQLRDSAFFTHPNPMLRSSDSVLQNPHTQLAIGYSVRKVRVDHQTKTVISIAEMQVYDGSKDDESNIINKALNKPAQQSSTVDGYPASNAVDGNANTFSHTNNAGKSPVVFSFIHFDAQYQ